MVFPTSKLPSAAQPWGRFVEKSITNVETLVSTERVNNAARDAQNSLNIKRLDQSVTAVAAATIVAQQAADDAQAAIDGITSLGSIDSPYTINAGNINAGTLTGVTIQSAPSGKRVEITSDRFLIYDSAGSISGRLEGTTVSNEFRLATTSLPDEDGWFGGQRAEILLKPGSVNIDARTGVTYYPPVTISNGSATVPMTLTTGNAIVQVNLSVAGNLSVTGTSTLTGAISAPGGISSSLSVAGNLSTDGALTRTILATGVSTTCTINGSGQFVRTTSSARYKQDIESINVPLSTVLQMEPRKFRLIEEVEANPDARYYGGFIAEELDALGLDTFVGYEKLEDGTVRPESVYYAELTAALVSAIKELNARIETLEGK